jgi:G6PDH family F420-dependent oxidoreductase
MLAEAIDIFRALWGGGVHTIRGQHFSLDHARVYETPPGPIPLVLGVSGAHGLALAVDKQADGIMATEPKPALTEGFRAKAGDKPRYCEVTLAYGPDEAAALKMARDRFRFGALTWPAMSEIPTVEGFEVASQFVRPEDMAESVGAGPDPDKHLAAIRKFADAGFDHICLLGVGPDQAGFIDFFEKALKPKLAAFA